jgi:alpha-tubulin suppressor-like RCC1 family protein
MRQSLFLLAFPCLVGAIACGGTASSHGGAGSDDSISSTGTSIAAGTWYSCATLSDGKVRCWGYNNRGQLGDGSTASRAAPVTVSGIRNAAAVAASPNDEDEKDHACALLRDGTVRCWGRNGDGQLGDGTNTDSSVPVTVQGVAGAIAVTVGHYHSCALLADGTIRCWGWNPSGQLGDGSNTSAAVPVTAQGITNAVALDAGAFHTCAVLADGTMQCWGKNYNGQLGCGSTADSAVPVAVSGIQNAVALSGGYYHTCAVLGDGSLQCWGANNKGMLGSGQCIQICMSAVPVTLTSIAGAVAVAAGRDHTCVVLGGGSVQCWGANLLGQLGSGSESAYSTSTPLTVVDISDAVRVAVGVNHTCVLLGSGAVRCWGANVDGELGDGTGTNSPAPVTAVGF